MNKYTHYTKHSRNKRRPSAVKRFMRRAGDFHYYLKRGYGISSAWYMSGMVL